MTDQPGTVLRRLRKRAGLTQEQLAERSGVSVSTIRRLENGRSADHRLTTLHLLLDTLRADAGDRRRVVDALTGTGPQGDAGAAGGHPPPPSAPPSSAPSAPSPSSAPSPPSAPPVGGELAEAADALAREVRRRWRREEEHRRVHDPFPLPVRWQRLPAELTDHDANIQRVPPGAASPGIDLSGDVGSVAETYRRLRSGRLLVLGRAGSGKSVLATRFALDLLAARGPSARVPVLLSVGSWDPSATPPRELLIDLLLRDHPHLARRVAGGSTLAAALVDADLILPVLDGFDEIAESLRSEALRALNATSTPLVVTSRREEYARAVRAAHTPLVAAAGIELADLTLDDLAAYLPRTARPVARPGGSAGLWDAVLCALRAGQTRASANLAAVLRTPLMVVLARVMYSDTPGRDPGELLDAARFPTGSHLEEHLLAGFLPAVYRRRAPERADGGRPARHRDPERAQQWLGYLAHTLARRDHGRQELAWWRIAESQRRRTRVLNVALTATLCVAVAAWLAGSLAGALLYPRDLPLILLQGALMGPVAGVAFGTAYWLTSSRGGGVLAPAFVRLRLPTADRRLNGRPFRVFTHRFALAMLGGLVLGTGHAVVLTLLRALSPDYSVTAVRAVEATLVNTLVFGLVYGTAAGLVFGLLAALEAPMDTTAAATPIRLLASNRATVGRQALVLVPLLALGIAGVGQLVVAALQGLLGPLTWGVFGAVTGVIGGLGGGLAYLLAYTAWGQWLTLTRVWLPLTRRLPWDLVAFLDDAYRRGVLRQTGAVYQFRHVRLQHHLDQAYRLAQAPSAPSAPSAPFRAT